MSNGVKLDARVVPFPTSISAEAHAALIRLVNADGVPINALFTMPAPEDGEAWARLQAAMKLHYAASIKGTEHALTGSVETVDIESAHVHVATPENLPYADHVFVDLHGGALVFGGGDACRASAQRQASLLGARCYGVDYRMPPEHPYPAALDDCMATYRHLLQAYAPEKIAIGGRSAGGNLAAAMVLRAHDEGLPMPGSLVLLSPEVDLTESGDSFHVNALVDLVLPGSLMAANRLYAGNHDLTHPYLSPVFGEIHASFPRTFLQSGTRDLFLSNTVRMHRLLRRAGVDTELHVFEGMPHGGFNGAPEDIELAHEIRRFVWLAWSGS